MDDLESKHAIMREKDRKRIENKEASPEEIQKENAIFKFTKFEIIKFTY